MLRSCGLAGDGVSTRCEKTSLDALLIKESQRAERKTGLDKFRVLL